MSPLLFSAATLRQKKAALLEVIELQRKLIESHDANVSEVPSDAPGDSGSDRELEWHTEQAKRLDKFKAALHATRLQPDEFLLLVSAEWASGGSGGGARRPRELVPYLLRVNARSQLTFVPHQPVVGGAVAGKLEPELSGNGTNSSDDVLAGAARPRVFFMVRPPCLQSGPWPTCAPTPACLPTWGCVPGTRCHRRRRWVIYPPLLGPPCGFAERCAALQDMLKHVKLAADDSRTLQCPDKAVSLLSAAAPSSVREVVLEWRSRQPPLFCLTHEGSELVEVLGAHLRRYNSSRVTQVQGLKNIHRLKCTTFAASNTAHAELLRRLWICGFGGLAPPRPAPQACIPALAMPTLVPCACHLRTSVQRSPALQAPSPLVPHYPCGRLGAGFCAGVRAVGAPRISERGSHHGFAGYGLARARESRLLW